MRLDKKLLTKLTQNDPVTTRISFSHIEDKDFQKLCQVLINNTYITEICLQFFPITNMQPLNQLSLASLKEMKLCNSTIKIIEGLDKLVNLQELWLRSNQITAIQGLDKLTKLEVLCLSGNSIRAIQGLDKLANLQTLSLSRNQITEVKDLDKLTNLRMLHLADNRIKTIRGLDKLTKLLTLYLERNQITIIQGLEKLTKLKLLTLDENQITNIQGLDKLTELDEISLDHNRLTAIQGLNNLINLRILRLTNNQITAVQDLNTLINLKSLHLDNNPVNADNNEILRHWYKTHGDIKSLYPEPSHYRYTMRPHEINTKILFEGAVINPISVINESTQLNTNLNIATTPPMLFANTASLDVPFPLPEIRNKSLAQLQPQLPLKKELTYPSPNSYPYVQPSIKGNQQLVTNESKIPSQNSNHLITLLQLPSTANLSESCIPLEILNKNLAQSEQQLQLQLKNSLAQQEQLEEQLQRLQNSPAVASLDQVTTLKQQLSHLAEQQAVLQLEYQIKNAHRQAVETYREQPNLWQFYRTVYLRLEEILIACKAVASDLIATSHTGHLDKAATGATIIGKILALIPAIGNSLDTLISGISKTLEKIDHIRQTNTIKNISALGSLGELKRAAESLARLLTDAYADQIMALLTTEEVVQRAEAQKNASVTGKVKETTKVVLQSAKAVVLNDKPQSSAETLALFAVLQILSALLDGQIMPNQALDHQFWLATTAAPSKLEEIKQTICNKLGLYLVETRTGQYWSLQAVYRKPGIKTKEGVYYTGGDTEPAVYGYRQGSEAEAKRLGLTPTSSPLTAKLEVEVAARETVSASKVETTTVSVSTATYSSYQTLNVALAVPTPSTPSEDKKKFDVLEKQLAEEREARLRQERELAEAKEARLRQEAEIRQMQEQMQQLLKAKADNNTIKHPIAVGDTQQQVYEEITQQESHNSQSSYHPAQLAKGQYQLDHRVQRLEQTVASLGSASSAFFQAPKSSMQDELDRQALLSSDGLFKTAKKADEKQPLLGTRTPDNNLRNQKSSEEMRQERSCACTIL